jgi:RNA polymerase sigma-70 factor, ECF subfamily
LKFTSVKIVTENPVPHNNVSDSSISSSLLDRAKQGDNFAFQRISMLYSGLVYHWCRTTGLSPQDSEDTSQQIFMSVSRNLSRFRREKTGDSFRGWLRVIARTKIADQFRENASREVATGGQPFLNSLSSPVRYEIESEDQIRQETLILYERAMAILQNEFADNDSKAFRMVVIDSLPARMVAENLKITINSVYIAKSRILKRLRDEFSDLIDDDRR